MKLLHRAPVVVILGHVDHGKTTLLDYIKKTNRTAKEVGGITQSIGGFSATLDSKEFATNKITFIDTPGHEAFSKLRIRGSEVADCAILIVSATDSVMPQTKESLFHIKSAGIPYIVAVNKIDMPGANVEKVKQDLIREGVLFEGMGGDVPLLQISAKVGTGVKELLEMILFMASLKELTYSTEHDLKAVIIESKKDKAGMVISAIIKDGILKVGDTVYVGPQMAKVRALIDDEGKQQREVTPSTPFQLLGFKDLPEVGAALTKESVVTTIKPEEKEEQKKEANGLPVGFFKPEKKDTLKLIVKTDSQGSLDALLFSLAKNEMIEVVLAGLGEISKSDIFLARVSGAIIIGFSTTPSKSILEFAEQEKIIIKTYSLIYELLDELDEVSLLMQEKELAEKQVKGEAKVMATFIIEKEKIAGIQVTKGKINLKDEIELYRNDKIIGKAKITSLKTRARDVVELKKGMDGGMLFYPILDFVVGDVIKSYSI